MKAKFHGSPFFDYKERKWLITFETPEQPLTYDRLKDKLLNVEVKEDRKKRSLNANAYFHVLVDKIADETRASHTEVHNRMICEYGQADNEVNCIIMKDEIPWERLETIHLQPTTNTSVLDDGKLYRVFRVMRGSHTYDTREMSILIDGVVNEAKELGIETLSPEELERMKNQWKVS